MTPLTDEQYAQRIYMIGRGEGVEAVRFLRDWLLSNDAGPSNGPHGTVLPAEYAQRRPDSVSVEQCPCCERERPDVGPDHTMQDLSERRRDTRSDLAEVCGECYAKRCDPFRRGGCAL